MPRHLYSRSRSLPTLVSIVACTRGADLFNARYYHYAIASQFTPGVCNACSLPGLNGSVALTYTFQ